MQTAVKRLVGHADNQKDGNYLCPNHEIRDPRIQDRASRPAFTVIVSREDSAQYSSCKCRFLKLCYYVRTLSLEEIAITGHRPSSLPSLFGVSLHRTSWRTSPTRVQFILQRVCSQFAASMSDVIQGPT